MQLSVVNGSFHYRPESPILRDVNFTVETPEILAVLGANGAGKTTLVKCLLGFEHWSSGQTLLNGQNIRDIPAKTFWSAVGYVPQAKAPVFSYTIEELVVLGRSIRVSDFSQPGREDWQMVHEMLETVGIAHLAKRRANEVSGGQYQLALIARALVAQPQLIVLDEPESNLDYKNQLRVLTVLEELRSKHGVGAVINTHYPAHALELADKALIMMPGTSPLFGEARDILTSETLTRSFGVGVRIVDVNLPERPNWKAVAAYGRP